MMPAIRSRELQQGRLRRLKAMLTKEFLQIIRDPSSILISVVLPLLLLFLYGFGVSLDLNHLRIGLVLEDSSPIALDFADSLLNSHYFDVTTVVDRRQLQDALTRGTIRGIVIIPSYFSAFLARRATVAPIQVIADGSEPNTANFVQYYVQGAYQNWLQQEQSDKRVPAASKVGLQQRFWYNEQLESRFFLLPGSLAIIMTLIGTLLTSLVVAREWERGTMEALISTPISKAELIAGKVIPYFILGMVSMGICVAVSTIGYDLPLRGSWWLLSLVSAVFLFCSLGFGLLVSTVSKSQFVACQISITAGFLPAYILSGFLFEIASMPYWIQMLTWFIPAKYFVQCLQALFLVGNVWQLVLINMLPMFLIGVLLFWITARKTAKRLD
jgi:ABC-2 type transport system permease protein